MTSDQNKHIDAIYYNHLNLPTVIKFDNGTHIAYTYDAAGSKLTKAVNYGNYHVTTTYMDGYQYEEKPLAQGGAGRPQLLFFPTAEGYVKAVHKEKYHPFEEAKFQFIYNYTDHLGNIRLSYTKFRDDIVKLEETHYYPFGLKHGNYYTTAYTKLAKKEANELVPQNLLDGNLKIKPTTDRAYKYKYNGKEWQEELDLNVYDYGARMYDPATARWYSVDAFTEKYKGNSNYVYALNNPVIYVDPDGNQVEMCCEALIGFISGAVDDLVGTNTRENIRQHVENVAEFDLGTKTADAASLVGAAYLMVDGGKNVAMGAALVAAGESVTLSTAGLSSEVTVPAAGAVIAGAVIAGVGILEAIVSKNLAANATKNFAKTGSKSFATDSNKNDRHGDRQAIDKTEKQLDKLKAELSKAPKKEAKKIRNKMNRIRQTAEKNKKGETHTRKTKKR